MPQIIPARRKNLFQRNFKSHDGKSRLSRVKSRPDKKPVPAILFRKKEILFDQILFQAIGKRPFPEIFRFIKAHPTLKLRLSYLL